MPNVANVINTRSEDIAPIINLAAKQCGLDPVHLLALLIAESGLNPLAERWGRETLAAKAAIERGDWALLMAIISRAWPDISFGYSQRIVMFHEDGDRSPSINNVLAVRARVFGNPAADINAAGSRLAGCFGHMTCDGSILSALTVYNAGTDRRNDPAWWALWKGNIASYERALEQAASYAVVEPPGPTRAEEIANLLDVLNGWSENARQMHQELADLREIAKRLLRPVG
jgi:hypothetical protein